MKRSAAVIALLCVTSCFEPTSQPRLYACNADGTCPSRYVCDHAFGQPAVCCLPGVLACPTLRNPDNTCADGSTGATFVEITSLVSVDVTLALFCRSSNAGRSERVMPVTT